MVFVFLVNMVARYSVCDIWLDNITLNIYDKLVSGGCFSMLKHEGKIHIFQDEVPKTPDPYDID